ncbi:MAG: hypothetical protein U5Q03_17175 [Bacteroidota bacterium]|nr:hypothetical protein [Bacteroidota bacterium]
MKHYCLLFYIAFIAIQSNAQTCLVNVDTDDCKSCFVSYSYLSKVNPELNTTFVFRGKDSVTYTKTLSKFFPSFVEKFNVIISDSLYYKLNRNNSANVWIDHSDSIVFICNIKDLGYNINKINDYTNVKPKLLKYSNEDIVFGHGCQVIIGGERILIHDKRFNEFYYVDTLDKENEFKKSKLCSYSFSDILNVYKMCMDLSVISAPDFENALRQLEQTNYSMMEFKGFQLDGSYIYINIALAFPIKVDSGFNVMSDNKLLIVEKDTIQQIIDLPEKIYNDSYYVVGNDLFINEDQYLFSVKKINDREKDKNKLAMYAIFNQINNNLEFVDFVNYCIPEIYVDNELYYNSLQQKINFPFINTIFSSEIYNIKNNTSFNFLEKNHLVIDMYNRKTNFDYIIHDIYSSEDHIYVLLYTSNGSYRMVVLDQTGNYNYSFNIDISPYSQNLNSFISFIDNYTLAFIANNKELVILNFEPKNFISNY